jgi:hypothetical protein
MYLNFSWMIQELQGNPEKDVVFSKRSSKSIAFALKQRVEYVL